MPSPSLNALTSASRTLHRGVDRVTSDNRPTPPSAEPERDVLVSETGPHGNGTSFNLPGWAVGGGLLAATAIAGDEDGGLSGLGARVGERHSWKRKVELGKLATVGMKLSEEVLKNDHPKIKDDALRSKMTEALLEEGAHVAWLDASGIVELGSKYSATFPIHMLADGNVGFDGSSVLEYRVLTPVIARTAADLATEIQAGTLILPTSREALLKMPPGTEFEIRGSGVVTGTAGVDGNATLTGRMMGAGIRGAVGTEARFEGNISLKIKALDHQGNIEVTLERDAKQDISLAASLKAALNLNDRNLSPAGKGLLKELAKNEGTKDVQAWWKAHKNSQILFEHDQSWESRQLGKFVLNVQNPDAMEAFRSLLTLDLKQAEALSQVDGNDVNSSVLNETSNRSDFTLSADLAGYRLLLYRALEAERFGEVRRNGRTIKVVRENEVENSWGNYFSGYETVKWDAVTVETEDPAAKTTFYNLNYTHEDRITDDEEIEILFNFAEAMGVKHAREARRELPEMGWLDRVFASRDDTEVDVDIYFTQPGIESIVNSSPKEARNAILKACGALDPKAAGLENLSDEEFRQALNYAKNFRIIQEEMSADMGVPIVGYDYGSNKYFELTGRRLWSDVDALEAAQLFLKHKDGLATDADEDERRRFFTELGKEEQFKFMPAMVALTTLAE